MTPCLPVPIIGCLPDEVGRIRTRCVRCGYVSDLHFPVETPLTQRRCDKPHSTRIPIPLPNIFQQTKNYIVAWVRHTANGRPKVSAEKVLERFRICSSCDQYNDATGQCSICACYVNLVTGGKAPNKCEWADEECPAPVHAWPREDGKPSVYQPDDKKPN